MRRGVSAQRDRPRSGCLVRRRFVTFDDVLSLTPQHQTYQNGAERPLLRGALHGTVAALLVPAILLTFCATYVGVLPSPCYWFVIFLLAKFASYGSSAYYHLRPFNSEGAENVALKADMTAVSVAIWGPSAPFFVGTSEWVACFCIACAVTAANYATSNEQVNAHQASGCASDVAALRKIRAVLLLLFFAWTVFVIGWHYGFAGLWWSGVGLYLLSFALSPFAHQLYPDAPWHVRGRNGWHEDFHLVLALADVDFGVMGYQFAVGSVADMHPPI